MILSADDLRTEYLLKTKAQGKALLAFTNRLDINKKIIDKIFYSTRDSTMDVGSDLLSKQEYLNMIDLPPSPFSVGALNAFHSEDRVLLFVDFINILIYYEPHVVLNFPSGSIL